MTGTDFIKWMKQRGLRVADVASKTGLNTNTVYAFRRGQPVHRSTEFLLERFKDEYDRTQVSRRAVAG